MEGFQAAIVPSSVAKMKAAGLLGARRKSVALPLEIKPVGVPVGKVGSLGLDLGMVTTSACLAPAPLYSVANPVASSETHHVLPELRARPQALMS